MKLKVIVHKAEEGGYWAEVPAVSGCATQGETFEELIKNLYEAVEGCLSVDIEQFHLSENDSVVRFRFFAAYFLHVCRIPLSDICLCMSVCVCGKKTESGSVYNSVLSFCSHAERGNENHVIYETKRR